MLGRTGPIGENPFRRIVQCKEKGDKAERCRAFPESPKMCRGQVVCGRSRPQRIPIHIHDPREKGVKARWIGGDGARDPVDPF
ncbi:hypothetical protein PLACP1_26770 [Planifilum fimeticola]